MSVLWCLHSASGACSSPLSSLSTGLILLNIAKPFTGRLRPSSGSSLLTALGKGLSVATTTEFCHQVAFTSPSLSPGSHLVLHQNCPRLDITRVSMEDLETSSEEWAATHRRKCIRADLIPDTVPKISMKRRFINSFHLGQKSCQENTCWNLPGQRRLLLCAVTEAYGSPQILNG